ncbi:methyltransferase domain-containing protein [bacterium]|nr:methyltransferase domain-containing protein [bacterium]
MTSYEETESFMTSYEDIFQARGSSYDRAMRSYPNARDEEFQQLVLKADLSPGDRVADIPAGGGYLKHYLPADCHWLGHEPCATFSKLPSTHAGQSQQLLPLPWADETIDVAVSLAGVHHLNDKRPLFREILKTLKPGGKFVLSDVLEGSAVAHFLDDFVGKYNSTGHDSIYLNEDTLTTLEESGWNVANAQAVDFNWGFASIEEMELFCASLFGLRGLKKGDIFQAVDTILSVTELPDGRIGMSWSLFTILSKR